MGIKDAVFWDVMLWGSSEEFIYSIIRIKRMSESETSLAATSNKITLRINTNQSVAR
jgi:uncharacterized protein HemX